MHFFAGSCRRFGGAAENKLFRGVKRLSEHVVERGQGSVLWTTEGRRLLDFASGIGVVATGHCHPTVVKAVQEQATKVVHLQQSCTQSAIQWELMNKMRPLLPSEKLDSFFFCNSGAEAVEGALRLARQATGRDGVIGFLGGYHGRTSATLAMTTSQVGYKGARSGPLPAGGFFVPFPYEHTGVSMEQTQDALDMLLKTQTPASDTAAVLIEPILGEGGFVAPPEGFLPWLREWCDRHGILLIADEVQSGYGRSGKMWAVEHWGVEPDILVSAKGIASGYPLAAVIARSDITDKQVPGAMGGTFGGNAVACAAAVATLEVFEKEGVLANAEARGQQLRAGLERMRENPLLGQVIADVRGRGLMNALEFADPTGNAGIAKDVSLACHSRDMLLLSTGAREAIRFAPPLVVTEDEVNECLGIFESAMTEVVEAKLATSARSTLSQVQRAEPEAQAL